MKAVKVILWIVGANVALVPAILIANRFLADDDSAAKPTVPVNEVSAIEPATTSSSSDRSHSPDPTAAVDDAVSAPRTPPRFDKVAYQMEIAALTDTLNAAAKGYVEMSDRGFESYSSSAGCSANLNWVEHGPYPQKIRVRAEFADIVFIKVNGSDNSERQQIDIEFTPAPTGGARVEFLSNLDGVWKPHDPNRIPLYYQSIDKAKKVEAMIVELRDRCRRLKLLEGAG